MSNDTEYTSKAITTQIKATSRVSVKIRENFYTLEYTEERTIPQVEGVDLEKERELLWDKVNSEVDVAMEETINYVNEEYEKQVAKRRR